VRDHATWDGVTLRTTYQDWIVERRDQLADAARAGDWPAVLRQLATRDEWVNATRLGGASGYTALHQAAWHGAPVEIVTRLVELGAWRTVRAASGDRPLDIAAGRGHHHLAGALRPEIRHPLPDGVLAALQQQLHALILERAAPQVAEYQLRLPDLAPLTELNGPAFWFPVPGMYGGFQYRLDGAELVVESWNRVIGGSGQTHRVTDDSIELVASGWWV